MQMHCLFHINPFLAMRLITGFLLLLAASGAEAGTLSIIGHNRWVQVADVYDGDTFRTSKGEKVRLLGINTPEIAYNDKPGQPMGNVAKQRLTELLSGRLVQLQTDKEKRDTYGRTLAHIFLRNGTWINAQLVREGLAHVYIFAPNFRRVNALMRAEAEARINKRGIWQTEYFRMLDGKTVSKRHIGQFRLIEGVVSSAGNWRFRLEKLHVSIPRKFRQWFKNEKVVRNGEKVIIHGKIRLSSKGQLYIALHSPADLE